MKISDPQNATSHRRRNPLSGDWVLVSRGRLDRPWQGAQAQPAPPPTQSHEPQCYLCAGNTRASGAVNPDYTGVYVFNNDYPALTAQQTDDPPDTTPLFTWAPEAGVCRVLCFSAHHSRTLSHLPHAQVCEVIAAWVQQSEALGQQFNDGCVQIFENKGEMMGCSNPHPHSQIWAQQSIPSTVQQELDACRSYLAQRASPLLDDYVNAEIDAGERLVYSNEHFVALVPFWATWPFETLILPRRHMARMPQMSGPEQAGLAEVIRNLSVRYDNLFGVSFPYSAGIHQAPANGTWDAEFTLHMHFYPPLLRSAEVRKFMVGYEMMAEAQRDLSPESAAEVLRQQPQTLPGPR